MDVDWRASRRASQGETAGPMDLGFITLNVFIH